MRRWIPIAPLLALLACAPPVERIEDGGETPIVRLIADDPELLLPLSDLLEIVPAERLEPGAPAWRVVPAAAATPAQGGGMRLDVTGGWPVLETELGPRWEGARRVEATVRGVEDGAVLLRWGRPGADGDVGILRMTRVPGADDRYRAEVDAHASWIGADAVRLEVRSRPGSRPVVRSVETFTKRLDREAFEEVARTAVKVELASEARNAFLVPDRRPLVRRVEVAAPCTLRFGYGVPASLDRPLEVRVEAVAGGGREVAWSDRFDPGSPRAGGWHDGSVDLTPFAAGDVRLELHVDGGPGADPARTWALWSNPEIVGRRPSDDGPSLVLISVDALRADRLSLYGHPRATSPRIDAWARERGVVFEQVVAAAPWTLPAHVSMFSGLDAVRHGVNHDVGDARRDTGASPTAALELLAERLRRAGFATAAFTGGAYVHPRYGLAQGFDRYASWPDRSLDDAELATGVDRSLEWIADRDGSRFFLFLHTYAVHDPYRPWGGRLAEVWPEHAGVRDQVAIVTGPAEADDGFRQRNRFVLRNPAGQRPVTPDDLPVVRALYDAGIRHLDDELDRLLSGLDALGVRGRTLIVLTSDHGESLGDHGRVGHVDLTDDALLVPLVLEIPGGRGAGRRVAEQVRQVDLVPTVLELLGLTPADGVDGVSLAPVIDGAGYGGPAEAFSYSTAPNRGLGVRVSGVLKYILNTTAWREVAGLERLHDLVLDPAEGRELASDDPRREPLRRLARGYLEERLAGLRLEVVNPGREAFTVSLDGAMVQGVGTVTLGLDRPWVRWAGAGSAALEAPPGAAYTVVFEKVMDPVLQVAVGADGSDRRSGWEVDVRDLDGGRWLVLEDGRWRRRSQAPDGDRPRLGLGWYGPAAIRAASPAADDLELRDQLRALGYLE